MAPAASNHGILDPGGGADRFSLVRSAPGSNLTPFVERYWTVCWDLRGRAPHAQETLPWPCANLVIGTHRPGLFGVWRTRFVAHLDGEGWVVGVKFRPGGLRPFITRPMAALTDRQIAIDELFGPAGAALERAVHAAHPGERIGLIAAFLGDRRPAIDAEAEAASRIVDTIRADRSLCRVDDLAARTGRDLRGLQRQFQQYVGVSPKWVIRRFRVQEAAERMAAGAPFEAAAFASECGYSDQSHFIRDFKAQVGKTPGAYAAMCGGHQRAAGGRW
jgi:AraC-like DNA-binding protein